MTTDAIVVEGLAKRYGDVRPSTGSTCVCRGGQCSVGHLDTWTTPGSPVIFPNSKDQPIRRASWRSVWLLARDKAGLPHFRFHDLRHTGNTLAAATGASTKELMARMGHASMRAAVIYQHATTDRDAAIATALSQLAVGETTTTEPTTHQGPTLRAAGRARSRATGT